MLFHLTTTLHTHTQTHTCFCTQAHTGATRAQTPRQHKRAHTHRLLDMAVTRWMTSSPSAAKTNLKPHTYTHTQTQQLRRSNTCTFLLCNGKCQSLSMASPGNAVIPSLPPIALIIGKCHLISQVHVAWLISEKGNERQRWWDGESCPRACR